MSPYEVLKKAIYQKVSRYDKLILELSGGVESSSIATILAYYKKDKDIRFHTYVDKFSLSSNELKFAKQVSDYFNFKLNVIELSSRLPFTPFTEEIPFHVLPGSYSCLYKQQRYIASLYDKQTLFINGHGGDSIYLAPSPPALFLEILFTVGVKSAVKTLYGIALQHHSSIPYEIKESLKSNYISKRDPELWYFDSVKNLNKYIRPATIFWWQALGATISEVLPVLNSTLSSKTVYYPFLSSPVIINALKTGLDKLVNNEFNRYPLRKSVYLNTGYNGIWRTDKGDTTHNMLDGFSKNYHFVRDFILGGYIAEKNIIDIKGTEKALKTLNLGLPERLPTIVRLYSTEACIRSITTGVL
ncbi:asparagine synthase-related protein [Enterobacter sichuanensis]